jgi:hypothetical protein
VSLVERTVVRALPEVTRELTEGGRA